MERSILQVKLCNRSRVNPEPVNGYYIILTNKARIC